MRAATVIALAASAGGALFATSIAPAHSQSSRPSASQDQTLVPRGNEKPSFDCAKAKTAAAKLICADGELAGLDGQLGTAFQKRMGQLPVADQSKLVADELAWINDRNERCRLDGRSKAIVEQLSSAKPCMIHAIQERIASLRQPQSAPASTAVPPSSFAAPLSSLSSWTQITSLTEYAKRIKHQWVKYGAEGFRTSYVDLASIIREGDTVAILDMEDLNPPMKVIGTSEYLGSSLELVRYDCGSTPRSMIAAGVAFHGNMGSGSPQDGAADVPKEPPNGWHVMTARNSGMHKARDMACNAISSSQSTVQAPANAAPSAAPVAVMRSTAAVVGLSSETRQLICTAPGALAYLKNKLRDMSRSDLELREVVAMDSRTCRATLVEYGKRMPGTIKLERVGGYERIEWDDDAGGRSMSWPTGVRFNEPPNAQPAGAAPAIAGSALDKRIFCDISVPGVAKAAYCSIWRSKCALPKTIETRDEIIYRLYTTQQISPFLGPSDVTYLVDQAIKFEDGDSAAFTNEVVDGCKQSFDQMQNRRREENITR